MIFRKQLCRIYERHKSEVVDLISAIIGKIRIN